MMREIAVKAGNFRGVCPSKIGRLRNPLHAAYITVLYGPAGDNPCRFPLCRGMIRTVACIKDFSPYEAEAPSRREPRAKTRNARDKPRSRAAADVCTRSWRGLEPRSEQARRDSSGSAEPPRKENKRSSERANQDDAVRLFARETSGLIRLAVRRARRDSKSNIATSYV